MIVQRRSEKELALKVGQINVGKRNGGRLRERASAGWVRRRQRRGSGVRTRSAKLRAAGRMGGESQSRNTKHSQ